MIRLIADRGIDAALGVSHDAMRAPFPARRPRPSACAAARHNRGQPQLPCYRYFYVATTIITCVIATRTSYVCYYYYYYYHHHHHHHHHHHYYYLRRAPYYYYCYYY